MEQAMVAAGRSLAEVALLDDDDGEPSQAGIPGDAEAAGAAADDKELGG
jgi:hypothetical protein